jgi:hypothetical protein
MRIKPSPRATVRPRLLGGSLLAVSMLASLAVGQVVASSPAAHVLATGLPSRTLTPGATNPAVTQATIHQTICVRGWTASMRPP